LLDWCRELDIRELTVYAFSVQNFNRDKLEFEYLMKVLSNFYDKINSDSKFINSGVRVKILGDLELFSVDIKQKVLDIVEKTKDNDSYFLNVAFGYGGREEILRATKNIALKVKQGVLDVTDIDKDLFAEHLYLSSEPDFIIRTGGDIRTSNFLPWQSVYSEWFFLDKKWPEFEKEDLISCIDQFKKRERRFGK